MDDGPSALDCGGPPPARRPKGVVLTGRFPIVVSSAVATVHGTVELTSSVEHVLAVMNPVADAFCVQEGRIVTLPPPQDSVGVRVELEPGLPMTMPATASLDPCDGASAGKRLMPGRYELYARVVLYRDDQTGPRAGATLEVLGGPWVLEIS